jgi:hypothetical protein
MLRRYDHPHPADAKDPLDPVLPRHDVTGPETHRELDGCVRHGSWFVVEISRAGR